MNELAEVAALGRLVERLGGAPPQGVHRDEVLAAFPEVETWLGGDGPQPDPHTVSRMLSQHKPLAWQIRPSYGAAIYAVAFDCLIKRLTIPPVPAETKGPEADAWVQRFCDALEEDPVASTWEHNAGLIKAASEQGGFIYTYRGKTNALFGLMACLPGLTPECTQDKCPSWPLDVAGYEEADRRRWDECCEKYFDGRGRHEAGLV